MWEQNQEQKDKAKERGSTNASYMIVECVKGAFLKTGVVTKPFLDIALLFRHSTIFLLCLVALYRQVKEITWASVNMALARRKEP